MKVKYQDKEIEVEEVDVILANEKWNEYQLADGAVLKFKDVIVSIHRAITEKAPDGKALYLFNTHRVVRLDAK